MTTTVRSALKREKLKKVPVWFMRQAGRYLPEYQQVRADHGFWEMITNPDLAAEVTLQPIRRFDLDAAIIFSDILVLIHGMGIGVDFEKGAPVLERSIRSSAELRELSGSFDAEKMRKLLAFYPPALQATRAGLAEDKSLFGFAAAPFTLASYLVEGHTSKFHALIRSAMSSDKEFFTGLMEFIVNASEEYLLMQLEAGVDVIQLFDSWADALPPWAYTEHIMPWNTELIRRLAPKVPVVFFCRGASIHRENLLPLYEAGASAISVDWRLPITFFGEKTVQGNLDPAVLFSNPETVRNETRKILEARGHQPGYIFNLGHGIYPGTPVENVEAMIETVKAFRPA